MRGDVGTPDGAPALSDLALLTPDLQEITKIQDDAVRKFNGLVG